MRHTFWLIIYLFVTLPARAQESTAIDSLRNALKNSVQEDTSKVMLYYTYGEEWESINPDSSLWYYAKARDLSVRINFLKGRAAYASHAITILNNRGEFREALTLCKEALALYTTLGTKKELAVAYINIGSEWQYLSDFELAAKNYFEAKKLAEELRDIRLQRIANNNLASIFVNLQQFEKGKQYAEKSLVLAREMKNDYAIASSMYNIANAAIYLKQYAEALHHFKAIEDIGVRTDDYILVLDGWLGTADAYNAMTEYDNAKNYFQKVIALAQEKSAPEYEMYAYMGLADLFIATNRSREASASILKGIVFADKLGSRYELKDLYLKASQLNEKNGNFPIALDFRKKFEVLNDSIVGEKSKANIQLLEARFESEKKEQQIKELQQESEIKNLSIRQNQLWISILVGSILTVIIIALLGRRTYQQKKKILENDNIVKEIKIADLEKEKQLLASEAVIKGQDDERGRLAKDLHDGLGGLLSGVKFSLTNMKSNVVLDDESALVFERSLDMLDHSISELRRVAHNMMPEVLVKFGLDEALKSYCAQLAESKIYKIDFQSIGKERRLEKNREIFIYRIVQELLNNISKHAQATQVLVQLARHESELSITVEDDGIGMNNDQINLSTGAGWTTIQSRVEYLKGKLDILSSPGQGTSFHITIPVS